MLLNMSSLHLLFLLLTCLNYCIGQTDEFDEICQDPVYNRNYRWNTTRDESGCLNPFTEEEVIEYVNAARLEGASIRAIGKSFSFSAAGMMEETNFNTKEYQNVYMVNFTTNMRDFRINENDMTMRLQAGMRVIDVCEALEENGLGLSDFGGPLIVNFIGSFNTGTHGKGSKLNPIKAMASHVIGLRMITADGNILIANKTYNSDILNAAVISMGSLGIVTEVTIQAVPYYKITRSPNQRYNDMLNTNYSQLKEHVETTFSEIIETHDFFYGGYQTFRQWFNWQIFDYATEDNTVNNTCWNYETERFNSFPCTDSYYKAISPFPTSVYTSGRNQESEFYVTEDDWLEAYLTAIEFVVSQRTENPYLWNATLEWRLQSGSATGSTGEVQVNTRWIGNDDIWLSPGYGDINMVQIGMYIPGNFTHRVPDWIYNEWVTGYYEALNKKFSTIRVHFGKASLTNHCQIKNSYPKMRDFKNLREELDPNQMFVNQLVRDKLGLCDDCCCTHKTCFDTNDDSDDSRSRSRSHSDSDSDSDDGDSHSDYSDSSSDSDSGSKSSSESGRGDGR